MSQSTTEDKFPSVLGIDIGGTGIKSAPVNIATGELLDEVYVIPTPQPALPEAVFGVLRKMLKKFSWKGPVGCGFPAVVKNGVTLSAANVAQHWIGYNALAGLRYLTDQPASIINDADAAALAEIRFGVGKALGCDRQGVVLMVTLGTGIGTAMFVNGILIPNTELGHIEMNGIDAEDQAATVIMEKEGLSWQEWAKRVNQYLQKIEYLMSPDVIIIGGGVSESAEKFFPYLNVQAQLAAAKMGNDAGIVGAALGIELNRVME